MDHGSRILMEMQQCGAKRRCAADASRKRRRALLPGAKWMPQLEERSIGCPYCGESISVLVDDSVAEQSYVEDCEVCCRPILLSVTVDSDGDVSLSAVAEDGTGG